MTMEQRLAAYAEMTEKGLEKYLQSPNEVNYPQIFEATRYSALAGGKRLRPALVFEFCRISGGDPEKALPFACALEMIHTYSLIHDDLPCMDNDDLRRGKPTNHKVFGEATAVLAGDALLTRAFEVALDRENTAELDAETVLCAAKALADAAGMDGMIGGQVIDMDAENKQIGLDRLLLLQQLKTGCLIRAGARMGCILGGATAEQMEAADRYAAKIGLAFQIEDDLLDIEGDEAVLGKPIGSDAASGKSTFPGLLGAEECRSMIRRLTDDAIESLGAFEDSSFLRELAESLTSRKS